MDATADRIKQLGGTVHVPPTDIPNISRFSVVADPQMATLALFKWLEPGQEQPAELDAPGRVGWHELLAADWEKALAFYGELLAGRKRTPTPARWARISCSPPEGRRSAACSPSLPTVPVPFWLYYFNVGDIDAAVERVKAGGGQILNGPIEVPGGNWIVQCTDPQGAIFALAGKRSHNGIGYFERVPARSFRWSFWRAHVTRGTRRARSTRQDAHAMRSSA